MTQPERPSENGLGPGLAGAIKLRACSVARPSLLVLCPVVLLVAFPAWKTHWNQGCGKSAPRELGISLVALEVQREAVVRSIDSQLRGKGRGGNLPFLHLLRNSLTHPLCLVREGQ